MAKHTRNLTTGVSDCAELQKDWNLYGSRQFEANVICIGPEWETHEARLKKENELICSCGAAALFLSSQEEVYNNYPNIDNTNLKKGVNYRVVCDIKGTRYESISEASRLTGEGENKIRVKLHNNFPGYLTIEKIPHGYSAIIANGKEYPSIVSAVSAGEAKDRFEAMRRLKDVNDLSWNYKDPKKRIDKTC